MITTGKIPDSHIVFLDEIFKSNEGVLNSLLTALNERRYTNESETVDIPAISFFSASNEIPNFSDPAEKILKPLYDRFDLKVVTEYIKSREKRLDMLSKKQNSSPIQDMSFITLTELCYMQVEVHNVTVPDAINELMDDILCDLRTKGIHLSDRKYLNYSPIPCAKAWLNGRTSVISTDLLSLKNYLWVSPDERETIRTVLENLCVNPVQKKLKELECMAQESADEFYQAINPRSLMKLKQELLCVYDMVLELLERDLNPNEKDSIEKAIEHLEEISHNAHDKANFTYQPLRELKLLS